MSSTDPSVAAGRMWARHEVRRRIWALLALGVLTGAAAAVALAALAGARQSASSYERLSDVTAASDAVIFASQVDIHTPDWDPVSRLPYVAEAGSFGLPFVQFVDAPPGVAVDNTGMFTVASGTWRTEVDRPVIIEGRAPDPTNPHELLASPESLDAGVAIGQRYTVKLPTQAQVDVGDLFGPAQGEEVELEVVGIGRSTFELAVVPANESAGAGFIATPAFHDRYSSAMTFVNNLLVRFEPGQGSIEQLERDARAIFDSPKLPVLDSDAVAKRVTNGTGLEATGLAMFGLAVALAGAALVGQALSRSVRVGTVDLPALFAVGFTRRDAARALAMPHAIAVVVGAVVAVVGAIALSPLFPIGLGRRVDPDVGVHVDVAVLALGTSMMVAVLVLCIVATARRATAPNKDAVGGHGARVVRTLAGAGAPPTVVVGAGLALESGRDHRALPTRPAIIGVVIGVIGVIGAQTLLAGMNDAIADPARFGAAWDVETVVMDVEGAFSFEDAVQQLESHPAVVASAVSGRSLVVFDGVTQPTYSITTRRGDLDHVVLDGRRPSAMGEVALGPETAAAYGVQIGDPITATAADGTDTALQVVGLALLPTTPHSSYDQGAWVAPDQLERIAGTAMGRPLPDAGDFESPPIVPTHLAALADGVDHHAFVQELTGTLDPVRFEAHPTTEPIDLANLRNVRALPVLFAAFTLVLAIGTVAHVCVSVVRRRGTELAVLRALGMTPGNIRAALAWQATTLSAIGLVVGLPLGVLVGRLVWRVVADQTPLVFVPPLALVAVVLAIPVTLLAANAIAALPGRHAARLRPSLLLNRE